MARIFVTLLLGTTISPAQTPPVIAGQPQNRLVIGGSNAVFSVAATGDNPGYQWYFNDTNAIAGAMSPTLILTNLQTTQAGKYSVSVSNAAGSVTSSGAILTVLAAPINPHPFGTLGYDLFEGTYEKAGMTNSRTASYNANASNLGTNTAVWTWPVNLSCVGYASDGYQSVLITSNQLLTCGHYGGESGQTVTFHDTNGVPWVAIVTNTINPIADMVIAQLSSAAPASIVIPYVLPPEYTNYIAGHTLVGMPAFWLHKNPGHIDYAPIADLGDYGWYGYGTWVQLCHADYGFSGSSASGGDSGAPGFLSWRNCPVLMFATSVAGDARGLFVSGATNWSALAALGLTNGMKVLDLSGYPLLTGNSVLPDLIGSALTVTPFIQPATWGDSVSVDGTVENIGSVAAGAFDIGFFLSTNLDFSGFAAWLTGDVYIAGLNPKSSEVFWDDSLLSVALPASNPLPGVTNYYIGMYVNAGLDAPVIPESNTNNNVFFVTTPLTLPSGLPQILATSSTAPFTDLTVSFGSVANTGAANAAQTETVTIINNGSALGVLTNVILSGSADFSIVSVADSLQTSFVNLGSLPLPLLPYGQEIWTITLQFAPTANGPETATLTVTDNDPVSPVLNLALSGAGVSAPQLALAPPAMIINPGGRLDDRSGGYQATADNPIQSNLTTPATTVDFGGQVVDGPGGYQATEDILFQNNGTGPLTINQNGIFLLTGTQFNIVSVTSSTQGTVDLSSGPGTIAAGGAETWDIGVIFDPLVLGVLTDGLQILSDDPNNPSFILSLQGEGLSPAQLVVSDSAGVIGNRTETFPALDATGLEQAATNVLLQNTGGVPLMIPTNGLAFNSASPQFFVSGIVSSTNGPINLQTNGAPLAPGESWTVTLAFSPTATGPLTDTLSISVSNLLSQSVSVAATVPVAGQGLSQPSLVISNSLSPTTPLTMNFGNVVNNGTGSSLATATLTLVNQGTQPFVIGPDGLTISGDAGFSIVSVVSSAQGPINLPAGGTSVEPALSDVWTITVAFYPAANGPATATLDIPCAASQDPDPEVALAGTGVPLGITPDGQTMPNITLNTPASQLNVSADELFTFSWQTTDPNPSATINLYLNANYNSSSGLIPIVSGLQNGGAASYVWQASSALAGTNYYVYATMTDGATAGSFAPGRLKIDPVGAFQLLSGIVATNASYVWQYSYYGTNYTGTSQLALGANVISVTNGTAIYQFIVTRVPSLTQVDAVQDNPLNQITTATNGNGIVTTLTYDPLGRLVQRSSSNGALVTYGYDVLGNRTNMVDYTGATFYQYDALSRLTNVITSKSGVLGGGDNLSLSYEYDLAGHQTAVVYPGGERIQYTYDNSGRLSTVSNVTRTLLFQYFYKPITGQLTRLTRPNGIETDYSYDGMGRLTNILHKVTGSGSLMAQYGYTLDAIGKATLLTTTLPSGVVKLEQYGYDYFDRLTNAIYDDSGVLNDPNALNVSYTYDGNGNRLTLTTKTNNAVTEIRSYSYGNENRLLTVTNEAAKQLNAYFYDTAGNRIQKIATNYTAFYTYDERNLMTSYGDATNQISYTYNGDAQRVSKTVNGSLTNYIVDVSRNPYQVVQERNGPTVTASYTFGSTRLATWNGIAVTYELTDRLGSVRLVTDGGGNVLQSYNYDVFGATR